MNTEYKFDAKEAYEKIKAEMTKWAKETGACNFVLGISGGKDSTITAALLSAIFGRNSVYGVMLPCGEQKDISDSERVVGALGIHDMTINIGGAFDSILSKIRATGVLPSSDCKINLPPRLRMATLFAVGQTINARVINTDNLTETMLGYSTFGGDNFGCFSPIGQLTVQEVKALGHYVVNNELKLYQDERNTLNELIEKTPADGLQDKTDEENLGMKYADVDAFIREDKGDPLFKHNVIMRYAKNKFKHEIVQMPCVKFDYENYIVNFYNEMI